MFYYTKVSSPLGVITLASDGKALNGLWFEGQKYFGGTLPETPERNDGLSVFAQTGDWLKAYFSGERPKIDELLLRPIGNDFRQEVWNILCGIPYGEVITYGEIADRVSKNRGLRSMSAQAVGGAVGHNPISIIIPCHRVVGANGSLTGYAGGIEKKVKLLEHEGVNLSGFFVPKKGAAVLDGKK